MPRMKILNAVEQEVFETPPVFTSEERNRYFDFPGGLLKIAATLRTPTNIVCFLTAAGYFKATRKFFAGQFQEADLRYVAGQRQIDLSEVEPAAYDKQTTGRHRRLIAQYYGFTELDLVVECAVREEVTTLIGTRMKPKLLFFRVVESLIRQRVVVPGYDFLSKLILEQMRGYQTTMVHRLQEQLDEAGRKRLDELLEKEPAADPDQPGESHAYRLTLLKKFSQSTKPGKIQSSTEDLQRLQSLYQEFKPVIESLHLTAEGIRHYAGSVLRAEIFQLARRADEDRWLHLLAFIAHQYFGLQDTLTEVLLKSVQTFVHAARREHKEIHYERRQQERHQLRQLVRLVDSNVLGTIAAIQTIVDSELADTRKVADIKALLGAAEPERQQLQQQLNPLKNETDDSQEDPDFYRLVERRSRKLQQRVSPILKTLNFTATTASTSLAAALDFFKTRGGVIERWAPIAFLEPEEQHLVQNRQGKLRVSLYKALLMLKTAEAIKSGTLNLTHSYKFRPLAEYLIPQPDWERHRETYLQQAGLTDMADARTHLARLQEQLEAAYRQTNQNLRDQTNPHLKFNPGGDFTLTTPKLPDSERETLAQVFPRKAFISLLEILSTINRLTGFLDEFEHWQVAYNRPRLPDRVFIAGIVSQGCDIGLRQMAHISTNVSESELENTLNWYFTADGISAANDRLLRLLDSLALPQVYRRDPDRLHTSSDGQKFAVEKDSLNASHSFKYFGSGKGVTVYSFLDERHLLFHSTVISAAERESAYVIDGLMHNDVVKSDLHSTDTHGYSEVIFATLHGLGFAFAPRLKNFKKQSLSTFQSRRVYADQGYRILPDRTLNTNLIIDHWDDILRFIATIKLKVATASDLFRRLNSYSRQHSLYRALKEFGRIPKSQHLLRWIDDVAFRQAVEKQLNKGEHAHRLARAVTLGNPHQFSQGDKQEQEVAEGCKRLIKNAILCWNYLYLSQTIADEPDETRRAQLVESVRNGSVVCWQHVNMLGEYDFSDDKLRDSVGFQLPKILSLKVAPAGRQKAAEVVHSP